MRIGMLPVDIHQEDPFELADYCEKHGFRATGYPHRAPYTSKDTAMLAKYRKAFEEKDIIIGEVGAWRNPFASDPVKAKENIDYIIDRLVMSDEMGARCTAMMVGNLCEGSGKVELDNMGDELYDRCVEMTRYILDMAKPKETKLGFEIFPFNFLDSTDMYIKLLKDIDRPQVTVHLDAINLINSPRLYLNSGSVMRDAVKRLAPFSIASLHFKDLILRPDQPNTVLEERPVGRGGLDLGALLKAVDEFLPEDTPVLMEHFPEPVYDEVLPYVLDLAKNVGVTRF